MHFFFFLKRSVEKYSMSGNCKVNQFKGKKKILQKKVIKNEILLLIKILLLQCFLISTKLNKSILAKMTVCFLL